MSVAAYYPTLKLKINSGSLKQLSIELMTGDCKLTTAFTAAADTNCTAVAAAERSAALVSFQWQPASFPQTQNIHSAVSPVLPADNSAEVLRIVQNLQ